MYKRVAVRNKTQSRKTSSGNYQVNILLNVCMGIYGMYNNASRRKLYIDNEDKTGPAKFDRQYFRGNNRFSINLFVKATVGKFLASKD